MCQVNLTNHSINNSLVTATETILYTISLPTNISFNLLHCMNQQTLKIITNNNKTITTYPSLWTHFVDMKGSVDSCHYDAIRTLALTDQGNVVAAEPNGAVRTKDLTGRSSHR